LVKPAGGVEPAIAVIGDCLLDVALRPEARAELGGDVPAAIRLGAGGQGANLAVRLARRGRHVRLVAPVGHDAVGELLQTALTGDGIELVPLPVERSGAVAAFIDESGERTMYSDRPALDGAAAVAAAGGCAWIHVSGYALLGDEGGALAQRLAGRFVSVNGGSAAARDGRAAQLLEHLRTLRPALIILSAAEAAALLEGPMPRGALTSRPGATSDPEEAARRLAEELGSLVVVTDAARGADAAWPGGRAVHVAAPRALTVDATGAGDAFAAAVIDELADGAWPPDEERMRRAMAAGAALAARVVAVDGAQARVAGEHDAMARGRGQVRLPA
jgi:ribokinase